MGSEGRAVGHDLTVEFASTSETQLKFSAPVTDPGLKCEELTAGAGETGLLASPAEQ